MKWKPERIQMCDGKLKAFCYDCGLEYPFGLDLILPDEQWNWIFPEGNGEGLLCPNCIAIRAEKVGASTVILSWIDRIDWTVPRPKEWLKSRPECVIDPVCTFHGKKMSEHICLYCCLCFKDLTPEQCSVNSKGKKEDICIECAEREKESVS